MKKTFLKILKMNCCLCARSHADNSVDGTIRTRFGVGLIPPYHCRVGPGMNMGYQMISFILCIFFIFNYVYCAP